MKKHLVLTVLCLMTSLGARAENAKPDVDCSKTSQGQVVIHSSDRLTMEKAAELAYGCFTKYAPVAKARSAAIAKSKGENPESCGEADKLQSLILKSWRGERPYPSSGPNDTVLGNVGGEATVMVREPFTCSGVGSGMYAGIVSNVAVSLKIEESFKFPMGDEPAPGEQTIQVKFDRLLTL